MLKFNKKQYKILLGIGIIGILGLWILGSQIGQTKTRTMDMATEGVDLQVEATPFDRLQEEPLAKEESIENHRLIAENEKYGLYLLEERVSILLKNKETGNLIYSTVQQEDESITSATWKTFVQSGIVMEYIKGTNVVPEQADMILQEPEIQIGYQENGFVARIFYPALSIG
ncbi:MAG: hypothetical protein JW708_07860, partial [Vallitaleaceae bacterium]|nr:hypothetical protein [Vallitaleaceae bacterium]